MAIESKVIQTAQGWFVQTPTGNIGPMDSRAEASAYLSLMFKLDAAGIETACTDNECFG